jgi:hypothetical protein
MSVTTRVGRYEVTLVPGRCITIRDVFYDKTKTFNMGEMVEYDCDDHLAQFGPIVSITDLRVRVVHADDYSHYMNRTKTINIHAMTLRKFCDRAINFDLKSALVRNAETALML